LAQGLLVSQHVLRSIEFIIADGLSFRLKLRNLRARALVHIFF